MKFLTIIFCLICTIMTANAQKPANCENCFSALEANEHIGENIRVYGVVKHIKEDTTDQGEDVYFLNFDDVYPNNNFSIIAFKNSYANRIESITQLLNEKVIVTGVVTKDLKFKKEGIELKPSIIVNSESQIK